MSKKPFVDFRDIRSRITMEQVLTHYQLLDTFRRSGHSLSGPCPVHKGTNKNQFRVDTEKNLWNCFSECRHGGNVLDFIAKMERVSIHDAALKACEWFAIPVEEVKTNDGKVAAPPAKKTKATLPAEDTLPDDGRAQAPNQPLKFKLEKLQRDHPYLTQERGLTQETIIDFGLGYFTGDKGMMAGHVVIPIHNVKGELLAYAGRFPGKPPEDVPKYKLPKGFKKSLELFNLDRAVKESEPLVIVEGFFDVIKLHQIGCRRVVAIMGDSMSPEQEQLIRQHFPITGHIIVMLDENPAGQAGRDDIAARLAKHCFVRIHKFDQPDMEPEHLTVEQVKGLLV